LFLTLGNALVSGSDARRICLQLDARAWLIPIGEVTDQTSPKYHHTRVVWLQGLKFCVISDITWGVA
jgi:hypothetical protein